MPLIREGLAIEDPAGYEVQNNSGGSIWQKISGWAGDTIGTYLNHERNQWFAREGIVSGNPNDTIVRDANAKGDEAGQAQIVTPIYKDPVVIGGALVAVVGLALLLKR